MICQNCHADVADDLVFCTECGNRLHETMSRTPTVLMNDSVVTKISSANQSKSSSSLKWIALIVALIAIPAALFVGYMIFSGKKSDQTAANSAKSVNKSATPAVNKPVSTPNNTNHANQNISNSDQANANLPDEENTFGNDQTEIWNERIEIAPGEHYAVPFKAEDKEKIRGKINLLSGKSIEGYVYFQQQYDEHFPDKTFKGFSIEGEKTAEFEQTMVKENYVLVFVNDSDVPNVIEGKVYLSDK